MSGLLGWSAQTFFTFTCYLSLFPHSRFVYQWFFYFFLKLDELVFSTSVCQRPSYCIYEFTTFWFSLTLFYVFSWFSPFWFSFLYLNFLRSLLSWWLTTRVFFTLWRVWFIALAGNSGPYSRPAPCPGRLTVRSTARGSTTRGSWDGRKEGSDEVRVFIILAPSLPGCLELPSPCLCVPCIPPFHD